LINFNINYNFFKIFLKMRILLFEINPFSPPSLPISLGYIGAYFMKHGFKVKIVNISEKGG